MTRCGWCGSAVHDTRACTHYGAATRLSGEDALRLLIPADAAIELVIEGRTQEILREARRTHEQLANGCLEFAAHYVNHIAAYAELDRRTATLPSRELTDLRQAREAMRAAQAAFEEAARVVADRLGVGEGMRS